MTNQPAQSRRSRVVLVIGNDGGLLGGRTGRLPSFDYSSRPLQLVVCSDDARGGRRLERPESWTERGVSRCGPRCRVGVLIH